MTPFTLDPEKSRLLVIDMQARLLPVISDGEHMISNLKILLKACSVTKTPVVYTEHYPKGLGGVPDDLKDTMPEESKRFEKIHFSCCREPGFTGLLRPEGRKQVVVSGIESHICVLGTVMDLLADGFHIALVSDACSSRKREHHEEALRAITGAGGLVVPTETVVYQLLQRAGTEQFRAMLPFFRN